ncbi:MAG: protein kinase, partial [Anaerolineae bacterium]|nr:protein kinase [Anaerolineae bacterium]
MSKRKLGKYEIHERLGRGGMAEVFRAYHSNLDRYVAIKVLHAFLADDPEFKNRFEREAQNIARLKHPNIVQVYDFEYDPDSESYYMVMELVEGLTLKDRLNAMTDRGEVVSVEEALRVVKQAALALAYAHSRSMIHRDVKPANLMLDHDDRVVLTDFGIAKIVTGVQFTASGGMVGTPAYMAPEQGLGEQGDERSDLYSLGVILYQLVTGELPYDADTPLAIILKHLNAPIPVPSDINPSLPIGIDQMILKSMAKEPVDRYQNAAEFIADLERVERGDALDTPLPGVSRRIDSNEDTVRLPRNGDEADKSPAVNAGGKSPGRRIPGWGWVGLIGAVVIGGYLVGAAGGVFPVIGGVPTGTATLTMTPTEEVTPEVTIEVSTALPTPTPKEQTTTADPVSPATLTAEVSPSDTVTDTPSVAPTSTPSATSSVTSSFTPRPTLTNTPSRTPRPSRTPTLTPTSTPTLTLTVTVTPTVAATSTPTVDITQTLDWATEQARILTET